MSATTGSNGADASGAAAIDVAERLFTAIGAGDLDVVEALLDPDVRVWTNFDDRTVDRARALRTIGWLATTFSGLRYDVVDRFATADGFVQRHVLRGTAPNGTEVAMPACILAEVLVDEDAAGATSARVTSMVEYLDPAPLMASLA